MSKQIQMVSLENLVSEDHIYRKIFILVDFRELCASLEVIDNKGFVGANGFRIKRLFKCLLLQFMEDLSDRQLKKYLQENNAGKYFCGFDLLDETPDFSLFLKIRKKIGKGLLA